MRRIFGVKIFAGLVAVILLMSCSSSRKADNAVYESGLTSADEPVLTEKSQSGQSDEDEVLRLLGLSPSSKKEESAQKIEPADLTDTEAQIIQLEKAISERDVQVANLKAELAERDRRITDLQSDLREQPSTSGAAAERTVVSVPVSGSFKERYDAALQLYENRNYLQALQVFDQLLQTGGKSDLLDNCQYWKGECYYGLGQYNQAIIEFEKVFAYNGSNKYADTQLKLGLCHQKLGNLEKARAEFQTLLTNYPDSEYVPLAERYLRNL